MTGPRAGALLLVVWPAVALSQAVVTALEVRDGRIARHWDFFDKASFDRQLARAGPPRVR
jgi:hypothetical protein